jgi:hypothetical protein
MTLPIWLIVSVNLFCLCDGSLKQLLSASPSLQTEIMKIERLDCQGHLARPNQKWSLFTLHGVRMCCVVEDLSLKLCVCCICVSMCRYVRASGILFYHFWP